MKRLLFSITNLVAIFLLLGCSKGSSGTAMLNLGEIRVIPNPEQMKERGENDKKRFIEELATVFTVAPGPYEFIWDELKNADVAMGYEVCSTKLKLKLKLNKKLQYIPEKDTSNGKDFLSGKDVVPYDFRHLYKFNFLDAEGKTRLEIKDYEKSHYILEADLENISGADGRISHKDNTDGLLDFYRFLTGESGDEYELVIDCGIQSCSDIKKVIEANKSMIIKASTYGGSDRCWKVVDL